MTPTFRVFDRRESLDDALFLRLREDFHEHSETPAAVMLSGGSTPLTVYRRLAANSPDCGKSLHLMFTDDRLVPASSPDSNFGNTRDLIMALGLPKAAVLHVNPELDPVAAAGDYAEQIRTFFSRQGTLRLAVLGVGRDGHTCSLFTKEAARIKDTLAIPVLEYAGFDRVSVTAPVLEKAENLIFFVAGEDKAEVLKLLQQNPLSLPAGIAVRHCRNVQVWTDVAMG